MRTGYFRALRLLHHTFAHYPARARMHILIRFLTAPFLRSLDVIPAGATILDIGAGHGTYARLAVEAGARKVFAVEPDLRKALLPLRHPRISVIGAFDDAVAGTFDVIVIYDATYRMPLELRDAIYRRVYGRLRPGGLFVLKDMDTTRRWKMRWARLQEWLSDRLLRISIGEGFIYESPADLRARLEAIGFISFESRYVGRGYPHPHAIFTAKKPG
jgi:SAM-dependent methyltransferase